MLAAGAREAGAAYNTYEGFVEPLPSSAMAALPSSRRAAAQAARVAADMADASAASPGSGLRDVPLRVDREHVAMVAGDKAAVTGPASPPHFSSYFSAYLGSRRAAGLASPPPVFPGRHGGASSDDGVPMLPLQSAYGVTLGALPRGTSGYMGQPTPAGSPSRNHASRAAGFPQPDGVPRHHVRRRLRRQGRDPGPR